MPTSPSEDRAPSVDVAVVGAGPAGIAAAVSAADAGCTVAVLDLADRIGGQYYRHAAAELARTEPGVLHHGWPSFVRLRDRFEALLRAGRILHLARHAVWSVDRREGFVLRALEGERDRAGRTVHAAALIVATGAADRQLPFPGWTLPGVLAVGGAQALLKGSLVVAGRRVVVAGTGPFLLSVADGLLAAGAQVAAVVEANSPWRYARRLGAVAGGYGKVPEALGYGARLLRHRVPYLAQHGLTRAYGQGRVQGVVLSRLDDRWHPVRGTERRIECDTVAVGYGFTPQLDLLLPLGCRTATSPDGSLVVVVDDQQQTSVHGVYAAGETTGVGGADLARVEGALAGSAAAAALGHARRSDARMTRRLRARRARLRRFAAALQELHPVRDGWTSWLDDTTVVCRCEEVTCGRVREAVRDLGARDPRAVKLLARPGMGWCQGRICGAATATLTAVLCGRAVHQRDLEGLVERVVAQPVPLRVLAGIEDADAPPGQPP